MSGLLNVASFFRSSAHRRRLEDVVVVVDVVAFMID